MYHNLPDMSRVKDVMSVTLSRYAVDVMQVTLSLYVWTMSLDYESNLQD